MTWPEESIGACELAAITLRSRPTRRRVAKSRYFPEAAAAARDTIKDHPIATVAIIASLAFAIGPLWKLGQSKSQTRVNSLFARLDGLQKQLPR